MRLARVCAPQSSLGLRAHLPAGREAGRRGLARGSRLFPVSDRCCLCSPRCLISRFCPFLPASARCCAALGGARLDTIRNICNNGCGAPVCAYPSHGRRPPPTLFVYGSRVRCLRLVCRPAAARVPPTAPFSGGRAPRPLARPCGALVRASCVLRAPPGGRSEKNFGKFCCSY